MTARLIAATGLILLSTGSPAVAHRLDEYLEATIISVEKGRIQAQIRLAPGIAVVPVVLAGIDTNSDGVVSEAEQAVYAERVLRDLSLTVNGDRLKLRLLSTKFPEIGELKEGSGEIQIEFNADVPPAGLSRRLIFENHHQSAIAAYLVNSTVPRDPDIRLLAQNRNYQQSFYQVNYEQRRTDSGMLSFSGWSFAFGWFGAAVLLWAVRIATQRRKRAAGAASA